MVVWEEVKALARELDVGRAKSGANLLMKDLNRRGELSCEELSKKKQKRDYISFSLPEVFLFSPNTLHTSSPEHIVFSKSISLPPPNTQ